ncbi:MULTISPECIES: hypothetical protein [unclassified Mesorhizobium]|uniref:hypothetical protein n=1 Tax=unclassified Mesorhizobium TaxID=325217 RepID=UPI0012DD288F|nr:MULTISPECIES: hypothetical protein [unclassified Mesorhizobium]
MLKTPQLHGYSRDTKTNPQAWASPESADSNQSIVMSLSVLTSSNLGNPMLRAALIFLATTSAALPAFAGDVQKWIEMPPDQSGIAVYVQNPSKELSISATDAKGNSLDNFEWNLPGFPLVRQYRVPPGEYQVMLDGQPGALIANAKAGQISYIEVSQNDASDFRAVLKSDNFDAYKSGFVDALGAITEKLGYESIKPLIFAPVGNKIYIRMAGPGVKPPPN